MSVTVVANQACVPIRRSLLLASLLALFPKLKSLLPESQLAVLPLQWALVHEVPWHQRTC